MATVLKGKNNMDYMLVRAGQAEAHIYLHGGHLTYWKTASGHDPIYMSPTAIFSPEKALRGGVPLCWPQFSDFGPCKTSHGFVRVSDWEPVSCEEKDGEGVAVLRLQGGPSDDRFPGHSYELFFTVKISKNDLRMELAVHNLSEDKPLKFTTALHTYFRVADIGSMKLEGFKDATFADSLQGRAMQPAGTIERIDREIDRIYFNRPGPFVIVDEKQNTQTHINGEGFTDTVLWNPWIEKTKKMSADLPEDAYHHFVCIESAVIEKPIELAPKAKWSAAQVLHLEASSSKM